MNDIFVEAVSCQEWNQDMVILQRMFVSFMVLTDELLDLEVGKSVTT
jgi:hypothetical protein